MNKENWECLEAVSLQTPTLWLVLEFNNLSF